MLYHKPKQALGEERIGWKGRIKDIERKTAIERERERENEIDTKYKNK